MGRALVILIMLAAIAGGGYYYYMQQQQGEMAAMSEPVAESFAACKELYGPGADECQCIADTADEVLVDPLSKALLRDMLQAETEEQGSSLDVLTATAALNFEVAAEVSGYAVACELGVIPDLPQ